MFFDGPPAEFYVTLKDLIEEDITFLLNYVIENRIAPESWVLGLNIPVSKKKES